MTRKDFELIAAALKNSKPLPELPANQHGWRNAVHAVANALADENPRFDHERFLAACNIAN